MLMTLNDTVKGLKMELHNEKYTHIEKTILDLNVKYCLTRDISLEVSEKHDALETSLMLYHHEKMKDINQTLAEMLGLPIHLTGSRGVYSYGQVVWDIKRGLNALYVYCSLSLIHI